MKLFYMALLAALVLLGWVVTAIVTYQALVDNGYPDVTSGIGCTVVCLAGSLGLAAAALASIDKEDRK